MRTGLSSLRRLLRCSQRAQRGYTQASAAAAEAPPHSGTVDWLRALAAVRADRLAGAAAEAALLAATGISLRVAPSIIPAAGRGVFVAAGGAAAGSFLTVYPGTYYPLDLSFPQPSEEFLSQGPPLFALGNTYMLLTAHAPTKTQLLVDGRPNGLSSEIFQTAAALRTRADACWLDAPSACGARGGADGSSCRCGFAAPRPDAARALGHLVNHPSGGTAANVVFRLVPLPGDVPTPLLELLPCIHAGGLPPTPRWVVEVRAARALAAGEELYADYGKDPRSLGYLG